MNFDKEANIECQLFLSADPGGGLLPGRGRPQVCDDPLPAAAQQRPAERPPLPQPPLADLGGHEHSGGHSSRFL